MTLEQLCNLPPQDQLNVLEKLSDKEIEERFLKPFLEVTRPEYAKKSKQKHSTEKVFVSPDKMRALAKAAELGIDMSAILNHKRGR